MRQIQHVAEDCAESLGTLYKNKRSGSVGEISRLLALMGTKSLPQVAEV